MAGEKKYVIVGSVAKAKCVVFDLDGVLIDSSARFARSLEEIGAKGADDLRDPGTRRRFWEVFLSEKYMSLDRPNPRALELLKKRRAEGYGIIIVTGRPAKLADATLRQLEEFGIPYDAITFRSYSYFGKDHEYKLSVLTDLRLSVAEAHDDSSEVCKAYSSLTERVYCWKNLDIEWYNDV